MSSSNEYRNNLRDLAAKQLLDPNPPELYIDRLSDFLTENPDDSNFTLYLEPDDGWGIITCQDCTSDRVVQLTAPQWSSVEAQRSIGFGSFYSYKHHCLSLAHKAARQRRLERRTGQNTSPIQMRTPSKPANAPYQPSTPASYAAPSAGSSSQPGRSSLLDALDGFSFSPSNKLAKRPPAATPSTPVTREAKSETSLKREAEQSEPTNRYTTIATPVKRAAGQFAIANTRPSYAPISPVTPVKREAGQSTPSNQYVSPVTLSNHAGIPRNAGQTTLATVYNKRPYNVLENDDGVIDLTGDTDAEELEDEVVVISGPLPSKRAKRDGPGLKLEIQDRAGPSGSNLPNPSSVPTPVSADSLQRKRLRQALESIQAELQEARIQYFPMYLKWLQQEKDPRFLKRLDDKKQEVARLEKEEDDALVRLSSILRSPSPMTGSRRLPKKQEPLPRNQFWYPGGTVDPAASGHHDALTPPVKREQKPSMYPQLPLLPQLPMGPLQFEQAAPGRYPLPQQQLPPEIDWPMQPAADEGWPIQQEEPDDEPYPWVTAAESAFRSINDGIQAGVHAVQKAISHIPGHGAIGNAINAVAAAVPQNYAPIAPMPGGLGFDGMFGGLGQPQLPPRGAFGYGFQANELDQGAARDALNQFILAAGNAEHFDANVTVKDALRELGLPNQQTPLPGMEVTLMPHQSIAVAWMVEHEYSTIIKHYGGILADEMGLGKTVQMIATMTINTPNAGMPQGTLIVAPLALLEQWKNEIETKTNPYLFSVHIYHGPNKAKTVGKLDTFNVVLTTYQTLAMELPVEMVGANKRKKKARVDGFIVDEDDRQPETKKRAKMGLLFQVEWHRVVLDEAQYIRNRNTRSSIAVSNLNARYRWCLTGTPIVNSLADAYSYLRFIRLRPWEVWTEYSAQIVKRESKQPQLAAEKLQSIFNTCLMRRQKTSMLDGRRLIELPPKEVLLMKLDFSLDERMIYRFVEDRAQAVFNKFLKEGTVLKNYSHILLMLLRLRQVCTHPVLIAQDLQKPVIQVADEEKENADERKRASRLVSPEFVAQMKAKLLKIAEDRVQREKQSSNHDVDVEIESCPICFDQYQEPVVTACQHVYCKDCVVKLFEQPEDGNMKHDERPCPSCRRPISMNRLFVQKAFQPTDKQVAALTRQSSVDDDDLDVKDEDMPSLDDLLLGTMGGPAKSMGPKNKDRKGKQRASPLFEDDLDSDDSLNAFIVKDDEDEEFEDTRRATTGHRKAPFKQESEEVEEDEEEDIQTNTDVPRSNNVKNEELMVTLARMPKFLPSTKMLHMMQLLKSWARDTPEDKVMVISQWTSCLELVAHYLTENDFEFVRYQGDMTRGDRDASIRNFMNTRGPTIMLMSLKAGGVGLNLTRANRVISLDLGWSEAVETQAFDRVHRLGQQKPVVVVRLIIGNTIEDRIIALQARKKALADGSLGEGTGRKLGRLSVREIAELFGIGLGG